MSVRQAQREIDSDEFVRWIAYDQIDPYGLERFDLQAAIISATVANAFRAKNQKPFKPKDFLPEFDRKPQTPQEMQARLRLAMMMTDAKRS